LHTMTWLAPGGGVDKNVFYTISNLRNEYEFHLAVGEDIFHNEFQKIDDLKIFICPYLKRHLNLWEDIKSVFFFYKLIKKNKYDIVHTHETKASLISRVAAWLAGCPTIIYGLHGVTFNDPHSKIRRLIYIIIEKLTIRMNDYIVSVSQDVINVYHKNNIGKKIPYSVAYSGIDTELFIGELPETEKKMLLKKRLGINKDEKVLINIGRFSYSKGQRFTIEAFHRLLCLDKNLKLLLVGEGEEMENCKRMVGDLGLDEKVIFYGFSNNVHELCSLADILILTSLREGLPRVVVEASLCKVPTVAFEVEGIKEAIPANFHEFIVKQNDIESLVGKIHDLLNSEKIYTQYACEAYQNALSNWDFRTMTNTLRHIYNKKSQ